MRAPRRTAAALVGLAMGLAACQATPSGKPTVDAGRNASGLIPHDAAVALALATLVVAVLMVGRVVHRAAIHRRLVRRLRDASQPASIDGHAVNVMPGASIAMVAGLVEPATFLSADVILELRPDELQAVLRHEQHHVLTRAPARLMVADAVASPLSFLRPIARRFDEFRAQLEIEADGYAIAAGTTRRALARAILRLENMQPVGGGGVGFSDATDRRLHALLGDGTAVGRRTFFDDILIALTIAAAVVVACSLAT